MPKMHSFPILLIVFSFISIGKCFPMVVVRRYGNIYSYALVELDTVDQQCWTFVIKSCQLVKTKGVDEFPEKITTDCRYWENAKSKTCGLRFTDEIIYKSKTLAKVNDEEITIGGEINNVTWNAESIRMFINIKNGMSVKQPMLPATSEGFNGFKLEIYGLILLVINQKKETELSEIFQDSISLRMEMMQDISTNKRQILVQSMIIDGSKTFKAWRFLFMKYWEIQQAPTDSYLTDKHELLTISTCNISLTLLNTAPMATGMFTLQNSGGTIWVQRFWRTKEKLNNPVEFDKLKGVNTCKLYRTKFQADLPTTAPKGCIYLVIKDVNFEPITKKVLIDFDFGNLMFLYFVVEGDIHHVQAYVNTQENVFTICNNVIEKFENARQAVKNEAEFKVRISESLPGDTTVSTHEINTIVLKPAVQPQLSNVQFSFYQYQYKKEL